MARRPKATEEQWYDIFADAELSEQATMLQILAEIHRQARRGKLEPRVRMTVDADSAGNLLESEPKQ